MWPKMNRMDFNNAAWKAVQADQNERLRKVVSIHELRLLFASIADELKLFNKRPTGDPSA